MDQAALMPFEAYRRVGGVWTLTDEKSEVRVKPFAAGGFSPYGQMYVYHNGQFELIFDPDPPAPAAPTARPDTPVLVVNGTVLEIDWGNTDITNGVRISIRCSNFLGNHTTTLPAGTSFYDYDPPDFGGAGIESWDARVQYWNASGDGPWSEWSNSEFLNV